MRLSASALTHFCIASFLPIAIAAPSIALAQSGGAIVGTVTDAATGRALSGVRVTVSGSSRAATTNERGQYRVEGLSSGDYTISAALLGSEPTAQLVHVSSRTTSTANFSLE